MELLDWFGRFIAWASKETSRNLLGTLAGIAAIVGAAWAFLKWLSGGHREDQTPASSGAPDGTVNLSDLTEQLDKKRYDFFGYPIGLLTIFAHARNTLERYADWMDSVAMDVLRELHNRKQLPLPLSEIAGRKDWQNDNAFRAEIKRLSEYVILDCLDFGIVVRERTEPQASRFEISELGLRLSRHLNHAQQA